MNDEYSQAANELLKRVAARSRQTNQAGSQPAPMIDRLIINSAANCTFIFNATPAQISDALRPTADASRTKGGA